MFFWFREKRCREPNHPVTSLLSILDNKEGSAILDRSSGVHEFGLSIDVASSLLAEASKTDLNDDKERSEISFSTAKRQNFVEGPRWVAYQRSVSQGANKTFYGLLSKQVARNKEG